ncbi:TIGR00725 family protein [Pseudodesulfovibrio sp. F-1]|uniref:TIGR00725 family protein n=1 Tax=Pseudodesulfovibrio alkaliphilus TaxID=2661613 RepID=A0A7K1KQY2_9BACT|nr:TIGR00725 family protein [Pseudodesulfovibrio alkaliphilus]MUM78261.1 TIGR00725 family protein [Pseudodesulfovibrio alkaliphilus]
MSMRQVSVVGSGRCGQDRECRELYAAAVELGGLLAGAGYVVVCGGLAGVMEGVCRGAREAGGRTIGILPSDDRSTANPWVEIPIVTGIGQMRNMLVIANGDVVVALGGGFGTLSEVALARKAGKPVVAIGAMAEVEGVLRAGDPAHAVAVVRSLFEGK